MKVEAQKHQIEAVCAAFGLGKLQRYESLGGTRNRNRCCETDLGNWVVRERFDGYCDPSWLNFDQSILEHLVTNNASIPPACRTKDGSPWCRFDGRIFQATPFVYGRSFQDAEPIDVVLVARSLVQFHRAGENFPERYSKLGTRGETDPKLLYDQAAQIGHENPAAARVAAQYTSVIERAEKKLGRVIWSSLPHTLTHGDIQPANVIIDRDDIAIFIDLDWCAWQPRIYDLAWALLLCCTRHETPICGDDIWSLTQEPIADPALAKLFLETYERSTYPLTTFERQTLPAQIILSWSSCRLAGALKIAPEDRDVFLNRPPKNIVEFSKAVLE